MDFSEETTSTMRYWEEIEVEKWAQGYVGRLAKTTGEKFVLGLFWNWMGAWAPVLQTE
jgi:hypothetical protein